MEMKEAIREFIEWKQFNVKERTASSYLGDLRRFCLYMRNPHIEDITLKDVMDYLNDMKALEYQHNSFVSICMALRKFFAYYGIQGYPVLNSELIPIVQPKENMPRVCTPEMYEKLMASIPDTNDPRHIRNRAIFALLWDTGARNSEICSIDMQQLNIEKMQAVIRTAKRRGNALRRIFWKQQANEYVKQWIKKREHLNNNSPFTDQDALFLSINTVKYGIRFTNRGVAASLRNYCNRAKIPYVNAHSMRHGFGHGLAEKGKNNSVISELMGHSTLNSSFRYTRLSGQELEKQYRE